MPEVVFLFFFSIFFFFGGEGGGGIRPLLAEFVTRRKKWKMCLKGLNKW
jgi:hypothetical protein